MRYLLHRNLQFHPKKLDKKCLVYSAHEKADGFYYLCSGLIGLYRNTESGKEHLIRVYGEGEYFGYRSLFCNQTYHLTTRCLMVSQIHHICVNGIERLGKESPETLSHLITNVCNELGESESRLSNVSAYNAKIRILDAIIHLFSNFSYYTWNTREIAEYAGTEGQTVIRYCQELKKQGLLNPDERKIYPTDMKRLIELRNIMVNE